MIRRIRLRDPYPAFLIAPCKDAVTPQVRNPPGNCCSGKGNVEADLPEIRGRSTLAGKRATRAPAGENSREAYGVERCLGGLANESEDKRELMNLTLETVKDF